MECATTLFTVYRTISPITMASAENFFVLRELCRVFIGTTYCGLSLRAVLEEKKIDPSLHRRRRHARLLMEASSHIEAALKLPLRPIEAMQV